MITVPKLDRAIAEAYRFLNAAEAAKKRLKEGEGIYQSKETGAVRRASMDLSRILAHLRNSK